MDVEYTGRQTTVTKKLKLQVEAGLERIIKIVGSSGNVHVILCTDKYRHIAEITVQTRNQKLVARCEATEMVVPCDTLSNNDWTSSGRLLSCERWARSRWLMNGGL